MWNDFERLHRKVRTLETVNENEALKRLRDRITYDFNQSDLAEEFGVSRAFMSQVLLGHKPPTEKMMASVGIEKKTVFVEAVRTEGTR